MIESNVRITYQELRPTILIETFVSVWITIFVAKFAHKLALAVLQWKRRDDILGSRQDLTHTVSIPVILICDIFDIHTCTTFIQYHLES